MLLSAAPQWIVHSTQHILSTGPIVGSFAEPLSLADFHVIHLPFSKSRRFFGNSENCGNENPKMSSTDSPNGLRLCHSSNDQLPNPNGPNIQEALKILLANAN